MAGADGRRGLAAALPLALALAVVAVAPGPTLAADEPGTHVLRGEAHAAAVADLDGDGANELVRIVSEGGIGHVAEAWQFGDERWTRLGAVPIPRLDESGADQGIVRGTDASATLVWHLDGRARVLVLARWGASTRDPESGACCLSVFELVERSGAIGLESRDSDGRASHFVQAFDVDADGTDELMLATPLFPGESGQVEVLRWDGEAFRSVFLEEDPEGLGQFYAADSDGVPGDDLILGPTSSGNVQRIAWEDGRVVVEDAHLDLGERSEGYISGIADSALVVTLPDQLRVVRWPRGEQPVTTARRAGLIYPYPGFVGTGPATVLAVQESPFGPSESIPPVMVYDLELRELGSITAAPMAVRLSTILNRTASFNRAWERYLFPYTGAMPGASARATEGFVWGGLLIRADDDGGYQTTPIAPMAGVWPIGRAGPEDGWMAVSGGYLSVGSVALLYGGVVFNGSGRTSLVPVDDLMRADGARPTLELRGAAALGEPANGVTPLVADGDGFELVVTAPSGSWVAAWNGWSLNELIVEGAPIVVEFAAPRPRRQDENQPIEAWVIVATPDGHAAVTEWDGTFVREPPGLTVSGQTDELSLSATLEGTVGPHTTVAVGGRSVSVDAAGRFRTSVDAWPWPHRVEVVARDLLGNEIVDRVEVVGLYDYRGLPWAAMLAAATISVGAVLFVRIPRRRSADATDGSDGDGRFEELDPIDGTDVIGP